MNILFDDNELHLAFAPLTLTRPVSELRVGILTIRESWTLLLSKNEKIDSVGYKTEKFLSSKFKPISDFTLRIAGNIKPTEELASFVLELSEGEELYVNNLWVAQRGNTVESKVNKQLNASDFMYLTKPWHLFKTNGRAIREDFIHITKGRTTQHLSSSNRVIGNNEIFLEEGAQIECAILNATDGPIYIGKNAEVMEGSVIRAPFSLGADAIVKMSSKIYGDTTIGPSCKVGGEISNSIFFAYSNKGHDGFVGNSIISEWCNLGADTNTSNLKNNYSSVRVYSYASNKMEESGETFCGVFMGDHSKTGINTMLNTATSVGVSANIFGDGFPPKYVNSFSWGGHESSPKFDFQKSLEVANNMMKRRSIDLSEEDKNILNHIYASLA